MAENNNGKATTTKVSSSSSVDETAVDVEPPFDMTRLLIEGITDSCTDEMIQLYVLLILNSNLDDTFKIEELRRNKKRVMIKFNRALTFDEIQARQKKVPELCGKLITFHKVKTPNTIRVSELANTCTKEVLNLYFSNVKISNGGDIRSIKLFSYESKALIQFRNYARVDEVMSRTHIICERSVKMDKYYGPIEEEYFKEEEEAEYEGQRRGTTALLAPETASKLVKLASKSASIDKTKLIVSNIQENVSIQQLEFFIQLITNKSDIREINWSLDHKGKLLIDFKRDMDIQRILTEFASTSSFNNINGKSVHLEAVNTTRTLVVLIKDFTKSSSKKASRKESALSDARDYDEEEYKPELIPATRDLLDLYFANKMRSGGGEVETIERKTARYWLVMMRDQRSVKEILARKHIIDEKPIKVFPYFDNFGLPYLFKPLFDDQATSLVASPFKLKIKDERLRYFCRVKSLHRKLNEILSESNALSRYTKQESNILYVNYVEKLQTKVPYMERIWRLRVKESIEYFLQVYKYEKLTLSFNQWTTITRTKQINDAIQKYSIKYEDDADNDESGKAEGEDEEDVENEDEEGKKKAKKTNAVLSVNETSTNVELSIVGPNVEVDRFIVKIKDIICKAYFTFELEEKIIKFKTYLFECEELLAKWLRDNPDGGYDSDSETTTLASANKNGANNNETSSMKLNKSKRQTIDEFISKLERDHLDMELSYGKLFQELGYTFLNQVPQDELRKLDNDNDDEDEDEDDDEYDDYKEFNDNQSSSMDQMKSSKESAESQMDKIKHTLDDLRSRISDMRKKFRQYLIKSKRSSKTTTKKKAAASSSRAYDLDENDDLDEDEDDKRGGGNVTTDDDEQEEFFKLCVYIKEQGKIISLRVHRKCKVRELKQMLYDKLMADSNFAHNLSDMTLTYNNNELINEHYTINDYGVNDKCTITLEFSD